jgi:hypothetical protein
MKAGTLPPMALNQAVTTALRMAADLRRREAIALHTYQQSGHSIDRMKYLQAQHERRALEALLAPHQENA